MSHAEDRTAEIHEESEYRATIADDLASARARWKEQETARTLEFQQEEFDFVVGTPRNYVGFKYVADGAEVSQAEWTLVVSTTKLTREEMSGLIATLQGRK